MWARLLCVLPGGHCLLHLWCKSLHLLVLSSGMEKAFRSVCSMEHVSDFAPEYSIVD